MIKGSVRLKMLIKEMSISILLISLIIGIDGIDLHKEEIIEGGKTYNS